MAIDLSTQDRLRLNVLLANQPQAIRINESTMTVYGLSSKGEAQIQLSPSGRHEQYIKGVKELLSGQVLGSPGGYPVYLQRWTRMGQMRDDSLEQLLLLGEPEAVVAAVCAQGLSDELARRAWWVMEDATNARHMLKKDAVVRGTMGPVLAEYLVEHLPFEAEPEVQVETVGLVLQPGLLDEAAAAALWRKAQRKPAYYLGFLAARPDDLPDPVDAHPLYLQWCDAGMDPPQAALENLLWRVFSPAGQTFLETVGRVFERPSNQEVVNLGLDCLAKYFSAARPEGAVDLPLEQLQAEADDWLGGDLVKAVFSRLPGIQPSHLRTLRVMSGLGYGVVRPVFRDSTAIGSLMRRKLQPLLISLNGFLGELSRKPSSRHRP